MTILCKKADFVLLTHKLSNYCKRIPACKTEHWDRGDEQGEEANSIGHSSGEGNRRWFLISLGIILYSEGGL